MPEVFNKKIGFTYKELVEGGVMSLCDYRNNLNRNKILLLRRACKGTEALICYETMHRDIKDKVHRIFGTNIKEIAHQNPLKKFLLIDPAAEHFFETYKLSNGKHLTTDKQAQYVANAVALNAIDKFISDRKMYRKTRGGNGVGKSTWPDIIAALKAYQPEWGWQLPGSERNLRQKLQEYKENGYDALISGKLANENAAAIKESDQQSTLRQLLRHPNNLNDEQVLITYNEIAKRMDWRCISASTVANRRAEWNLTIASGRRGAEHFNNTIAMQHKRSAPGYPMKFWSMDGWLVELLYQKQQINDKGHSITTYDNRLTVVKVIDTFTNYIIGYAIGTHETPGLNKAALKNALLHTKELFGCIFRPNQLQTDHYAIGKLSPLYEAISPRYTPARIKNAKAKPVEKHFDVFNKKYFQFCPNWSGHNVTSRAENQPNEEYKNKIRHHFPDEAGCMAQIIDAIETDRAEKRDLFIQKFGELPAHHKLPWTTEQFLYNLGETTGYTNKLQGSGLTLTVNKTPYVYDCFDVEFRRHAHLDWVVKFDPQDMSMVLAHSTDGTTRFMLTEKYVQPMALVDRTEGDGHQLALVNNHNKQLKEVVMQQIQEDGDRVMNMFNSHPQLNDTLDKMRIVDSMGQHKDRLNNNRLQKAAQKVIEKQERKVIAHANAEKASAYNEYLDGKIDISEYL